MRWLLLAVFALTYAAISARRLRVLPIGRPAVALLGACLMVSLGSLAGPHGLTPDEALAAVEPATMALLAGMMMLASALDLAGFFRIAAGVVLARVQTAVPLLYAVTIGSGVLSALLVNDAVCLLATPFVLLLCRRLGAPLVPFALAVAMGANAGSAMTLAGNPQNMLVARLSGLSYARYLAAAGPAGLAALLATAALLHAFFRRELGRKEGLTPPAPSPRLRRVEGEAPTPALPTVVGRELPDRASGASVVGRERADRASGASVVGRELPDRASGASSEEASTPALIVVGRERADRASGASSEAAMVDSASGASSEAATATAEATEVEAGLSRATVGSLWRASDLGPAPSPVSPLTRSIDVCSKATAEARAEARTEEEAEARTKEEAEARTKEEAEARTEEEAKARTEEEAEARTEEEAEARAEEEAEARTKEEAEAGSAVGKLPPHDGGEGWGGGLPLYAPKAGRGGWGGEVPPLLLPVCLATLVAVAIADLAGAHLAFTALTGASVALLASGRAAPSIFPRIDWTVLVFFAGLFIVVAALRKTGLPAEALEALTLALPPRGASGLAVLCGVLLLGSQIVSNVPLILLLEPWIRGFPDATVAWTLTALVSTLAGNLTLLGSVANIIVLEQAGLQDRVGFWQYTRVGLVVTAVSLGAALAVLWWLGP